MAAAQFWQASAQSFIPTLGSLNINDPYGLWEKLILSLSVLAW